MKVQLNCAVRNVTGSRHMIEINGKHVLLDCGLYQGRRKDANKINRHFHFNPKQLHNVILSHAHIDHSGALPCLTHAGFKNKIFATPATISLATVLLHDSAHIQQHDAEYLNRKRRRKQDPPIEALYTEKDVDSVLKRFVAVPYGQWFEPAPGMRARFHDAGHILGSAVVDMELTEGDRTITLGFTGDLGRKSMPILRDPVAMTNLDALITESTYGGREHPDTTRTRDQLRDIVNDVHQRKGRLIIPAFSVGRTQTLLYYLQQLREKDQIPEIKIFVDSPLAIKATDIVSRHPECFDKTATRLDAQSTAALFHFPGVEFTASVEASRAINHFSDPCIIISASGMCEAGRILHHLKHNVGKANNAILIVGWQAPHTLGRRLLEDNDWVRIFDRRYKVKAEVISINGLSAHADGEELAAYAMAAVKPEGNVIIVHGEITASEALAKRLQDLGHPNSVIPQNHDWILL